MKNILFISFICCLNFVADPIATHAATTVTPSDTALECVGQQGLLRWFYWNSSYRWDHFFGTTHINNLWGHPYFPQAPDGMIPLNAIKSPTSFNDHYGSMIKGFITVPETGNYTFNVKGDNHALFYLSTDMTTDNLTLTAEVPYTGFVFHSEGHDKYESQTSETIYLEVNTYYYFEAFNKETNVGDYVEVYWKIPSMPDEWRVIGGTNVYDYQCQTLCDPYGTLCDDNDPNTVNDIEDGRCNCYGQAPLGSTCVGERGSLKGLYYDDIGGYQISDLEMAEIYPNEPTRGDVLNWFHQINTNQNNYGSLIKGFIRPPTTGNYSFKVTGYNHTQFSISDGENPANISPIAVCLNPAIPDTSDLILLQENQYYYVELLHKGGELGNPYFKVEWKIPNEEYDAAWALIDGNFLYRYDCETICTPEHTPCDDEDPSTFNDEYDNNCTCVGTDCGLPDCSIVPNYVPYETCGSSNQHTNNETDSWLSCTTSDNPNTARANGHWALLDLHQNYQIHDTHIWNYNKINETAKGLKNLVIDYSLNGDDWTELGQYEWSQATGAIDYEGFEGPDFGGVAARYILISALTNWGTNETCSGFSEWKMALTECPQINTPCDDGNPNNFNDAYNADCECVGREEPLALRLLDFNAQWQAKNVLIDWQVQREEAGIYYEVQRGLDVQNFESIGLLQGKSNNGGKTTYQLLDTRGAQLANDLYYRLKIIAANGDINYSHVVHLKQEDSPFQLQINTIQPNPFEESTLIEFFLPTAQSVRLLIFNTQGRLINTLVQGTMEEGQHQVSWNGKDTSGKDVETGLYYVQLTDGRQRVARKILKK